MYGCADPMKVENLRSPYVKTGELYYFARMIDKIRLHAGNQFGRVLIGLEQTRAAIGAGHGDSLVG